MSQFDTEIETVRTISYEFIWVHLHHTVYQHWEKSGAKWAPPWIYFEKQCHSFREGTKNCVSGGAELQTMELLQGVEPFWLRFFSQ